MLDLPRVLVGTAVLLYAVRCDVRTRRVPNRTWLLPIGAGLAMDIPDALDGGALFLRGAVLSAGFVIPLALAIYYFPGSGFGGADAKAFIALSVLFPGWPALCAFPLSQSLTSPLAIFAAPTGIFTMGVLYNALLVSLAIPPALVLLNIKRKGHSKYMWVGYRVPVSELDPVRMKILGDVPGASKARGLWRTYRGRKITEEMLETLKRDLGPGGQVWVTPLVPFMVSLAFGYAAALVLGNIFLVIATFGRLSP